MMQNTISKLDLENSESVISTKIPTGKPIRRKYAKKGAKTLFNKSNANMLSALSVETITKCSEGFASMGVLANKSSSWVQENSISAFLNKLNIKQQNFSDLMKETVVTEDKKVKFCSNGAGAAQLRFRKMTTQKVSSLLERRLNQTKPAPEEEKNNNFEGQIN
mmetsp:Transcript_17456/g.19617  ORF Transcript_17456/g.19617 Transcript_17456/m.19617 type:complete len:163 (-) Transcript_17456:172-660(-)|eukprot:CAMPEP_0205802150 /NCGR_PEP_ID=MMETSP0205-20121125/4369_1 /ASSEMBLY_ACC=CAM_ASM_000278 /TAXON_ID=36767 /ORGANISM="Euplotes focardii, Strain TN1" /LENGTH=162 /DNA_ID=CAMNT_0053068071 /DNA_START=23 /DNA_END=511 /DNA_ORIENTATION=+